MSSTDIVVVDDEEDSGQSSQSLETDSEMIAELFSIFRSGVFARRTATVLNARVPGQNLVILQEIHGTDYCIPSKFDIERNFPLLQAVLRRFHRVPKSSVLELALVEYDNYFEKRLISFIFCMKEKH